MRCSASSRASSCSRRGSRTRSPAPVRPACSSPFSRRRPESGSCGVLRRRRCADDARHRGDAGVRGNRRLGETVAAAVAPARSDPGSLRHRVAVSGHARRGRCGTRTHRRRLPDARSSHRGADAALGAGTGSSSSWRWMFFVWGIDQVEPATIAVHQAVPPSAAVIPGLPEAAPRTPGRDVRIGVDGLAGLPGACASRHAVRRSSPRSGCGRDDAGGPRLGASPARHGSRRGDGSRSRRPGGRWPGPACGLRLIRRRSAPYAPAGAPPSGTT